MLHMGRKHTLISIILILVLISGFGSSVFAEGVSADNEQESSAAEESIFPQKEQESDRSAQTEEDETVSQEKPELAIEEITPGLAYDVFLPDISQSDYDYVIMKMQRNQDDENSILLFPAEWDEAEDESFTGFTAHIVTEDRLEAGTYLVSAYGCKSNELTEIKSAEDITVDMLSDEETAVEIAKAEFEVPAEEVEQKEQEPEEEEVLPGAMRAVTITAAKAAGDVTPASSNNVHGIDVSHHQGTINWSKVKADGIQFAIIRCGFGDNVAGTKANGGNDDNQWAYNVAQCEKLGIPYGVYIYSHANTEKKAKSEADHCLRLLMGHKPTYPVFLDLEDSDLDGLSNGSLATLTKTWATKIQASGYTPGVYSSKYWWTNKLTNSTFNNYCKWVAQWSTSCTYTGKYAAWQYSSKGSVDGLNTNVDMNYWYCGWHKFIGNWYFYGSKGMARGWRNISNKWYYFNSNGVMQTNWQKSKGEWYFFDSDGAMVTGWKKDGTGWCYLLSDGNAAKNQWITSGGNWYYIDGDCHMVTSAWQKDSTGWCYLLSDGKAARSQWISSSGNWYYIDDEGHMAANAWQKDSTDWCYLLSDGKAAKSQWITSAGSRYYINDEGHMVTNAWQKDSAGCASCLTTVRLPRVSGSLLPATATISTANTTWPLMRGRKTALAGASCLAMARPPKISGSHGRKTDTILTMNTIWQ